jgi:hemoglobin/transferrin/lactoferrin receptor protein
MKILLLKAAIILAALFPAILQAQEVIVINGSTGTPVENVAIYNQDRTKSILTDEQGIANISEFNEHDTLYFQHTSFLSLSVTYDQAVNEGRIRLERKIIIFPEFVITASKYNETQREIPHMVDVVTPEDIERRTTQNSADLLASTGNIFVQKSQGGGGSPVLRGFEANKILLVVDGVRMNNAIYRSGHLQNSITIDDAVLEKTEIVYGPNAIMYGSDALGGVIHYITRDPALANDSDNFVTHASAYAQISSANSAWRTHLDFNLGTKSFGSFSSFTLNDFGDVRMGNRRNPFLEDYGKCYYYIERINNTDSILENKDPLVQKRTGYSQFDILQKFRYRPSSVLDLIVNLQYSSSSKIPRYDMLNDTTDDGLLKYAEWDYGPQDRLLSSIKTTISGNNIFFDNFTTTLAYQHIVEERISRHYRADDRNVQKETVNVMSANLDLIKNLSQNGHLIYGVEINFNGVDSKAYDENTNTGERIPALTRYPDDGSRTASYAVYASIKNRIGKKFIYSIGTRYNYSFLKADYSDDIQYIPYKSLDIENSSLTGSLGLIYLPSRSIKINALFSTGYRIPNLDDLAKIRAKGDNVTFPNPYVKPEYSYNAELGISKTFDGYIQISGSYFVSYLTNVIVRVPYQFPDGSDTLFYDGEYLKAYVNDNADRGLIHGFNLSLISDLNSNVSFKGTLNYTFGRDLSHNEPLAHIPPVFGRADIIYDTRNFTHEFYFIYSGWKRMEDMATTGEDNEEEATKFGFPGWYTFNLRTTYRVNKIIAVQFAVENVLNNFYKPFSTAVAAPGVNFIATLRVKV